MIKLRLARKGRKNKAIYSIVAADSRKPRDGKFISKIGTYNPQMNPHDITIDANKAVDFLLKGAQPTQTVKNILSKKGIMYKKHLLIGIIKGAITQKEADTKFDNWIKDTKRNPLDINLVVEKAPKYLRLKKDKTKKVTSKNTETLKKSLKPKSNKSPIENKKTETKTKIEETKTDLKSQKNPEQIEVSKNVKNGVTKEKIENIDSAHATNKDKSITENENIKTNLNKS